MAQGGFRKFLADTFGFAPPTEEEAAWLTAQAIDAESAGKWGLHNPVDVFGPGSDFMRPRVTPEQVEQLPGWAQPVGSAVRELTSPAQAALLIGTAGVGPALAGGIRGGTGAIGVARGLAAGAVEPVVTGSFGARLAGEAAIGTGATLAGQQAVEALPEDAPELLKTVVGIGAGLAGGVGTAQGITRGIPAATRGAAKAGAALEKQGFPSPISVADAAELTPEEIAALKEQGKFTGKLKEPGKPQSPADITNVKAFMEKPVGSMTPTETRLLASLAFQEERKVASGPIAKRFMEELNARPMKAVEAPLEPATPATDPVRYERELLAAGEGGKDVGPAKIQPKEVGQYGFGGEIKPPQPVDIAEPGQLNWRESGGMWVTDSLGERKFVQTNRLTPEQIVQGNRPSGRVDTTDLFYGKGDRGTQLTKPEYVADKLPAGPIPVQRNLLSPRGEILTPSGRITAGLSEEQIARIPKAPDVPEPPRPDTELSGLERPSIEGNIIGLREINPGLTRGEKIENVILGPTRKINKEGRLTFHPNDPYGTAGIREVRRVEPQISSQATQRAHREVTAIRQAFKLEEDTYVPSLARKIKLPGAPDAAPSIQDIADFYPQYKPFLTPAQDKAILNIVDTQGQYKDLLNKVGVGFKSRGSTLLGGGHYISRVPKGLLNAEDVRGVPSKGLFTKAEKGFEEEIKFTTMAEGRAKGIKYAGLEEALRFHYQQAGKRAANQHLANYMLRVTDDSNWPIRAPRSGELGRTAVDMPELAGENFPDAVAQSINKVIVNQGSTIGEGRVGLEAVRILNRGYRQVRATFDNSIMGIQMLLSAYSHPIAAAKAAKVNFLAWKDKNVLTRFLDNFDTKAVSEGRLSSNDWVSKGGVYLGAETGEFTDTGLSKLPGFKRAGQAYGYTGDSARLSVADALLEQEMQGYSVFGKEIFGKGRTLQEIEQSGDLARIGEITNNMTGVSKSRTGGDIGELLLFAPRFLQSRLETVGKGLIGLRPGASLDQKIARRSLLKMMAIGTTLTVAINEMNGVDTDFRPVVNGKKNPNFMRVRALGRDWSLFGTWDSLLGMFIAAGNGDAVGALRSQGSGITTAVFDLLVDEADFVGRSTTGIENKAKWLARQFTPFSGEQSAEGIGQIASGKPEDIASGAAAAVGTFAGAKSSELSFTDHANEAAKQYGTSWDELRASKKKAEDAKQDAILKGKSYTTFNNEIKRIDAVMDKVSEAVDKKYPQAVLPRTVTVAAKREQLARDRYDSTYGALYENQKTYINKLIANKGKPAIQSASPYFR